MNIFSLNCIFVEMSTVFNRITLYNLNKSMLSDVKENTKNNLYFCKQLNEVNQWINYYKLNTSSFKSLYSLLSYSEMMIVEKSEDHSNIILLNKLTFKCIIFVYKFCYYEICVSLQHIYQSRSELSSHQNSWAESIHSKININIVSEKTWVMNLSL